MDNAESIKLVCFPNPIVKARTTMALSNPSPQNPIPEPNLNKPLPPLPSSQSANPASSSQKVLLSKAYAVQHKNSVLSLNKPLPPLPTLALTNPATSPAAAEMPASQEPTSTTSATPTETMRKMGQKALQAMKMEHSRLCHLSGARGSYDPEIMKANVEIKKKIELIEGKFELA